MVRLAAALELGRGKLEGGAQNAYPAGTDQKRQVLALATYPATQRGDFSGVAAVLGAAAAARGCCWRLGEESYRVGRLWWRLGSGEARMPGRASVTGLAQESDVTG